VAGLSARKQERYLYGGCYLLALAIHARTGWEIVSAWVESARTSFGEDHAMVRLPDGRLLDAAGLHEPGSYRVSDELPDEYQASDGWCRRHVTAGILADADELLASIAEGR